MSEHTHAVNKIIAALADEGSDVDADANKMAAIQIAFYLLADKYGRGIGETTLHLLSSADVVEPELNSLKANGVSF
jgi:hypothetical protein